MQTAPLDFRLATRADEELLISLMRAFYAEDRIEFDDVRVRRGVDALLADPRNGEVLLWLDEAGQVVGYAVLAMGFSLEQGGHFVLLDELYMIVANVPPSEYLPTASKIDRLARWAVVPMVDDSLESTVVSRVAGAAERMLYDSARLTVTRGVISNYYARKNRRYGNVTRDAAGKQVMFQRFPAIGACDFCQMLAGRGAVYLTEASAGGVVGRGADISTNFNADGSQRLFGNRMAGGVKARGAMKLGSHYHDACRCLVQPVFHGTAVSEYAAEVEQKYRPRFEDAYTDGSGNALTSDADIMARWRKLQHV